MACAALWRSGSTALRNLSQILTNLADEVWNILAKSMILDGSIVRFHGSHVGVDGLQNSRKDLLHKPECCFQIKSSVDVFLLRLNMDVHFSQSHRQCHFHSAGDS
jgi:hypothetical protein